MPILKKRHKSDRQRRHTRKIDESSPKKEGFLRRTQPLKCVHTKWNKYSAVLRGDVELCGMNWVWVTRSGVVTMAPDRGDSVPPEPDKLLDEPVRDDGRPWSNVLDSDALLCCRGRVVVGVDRGVCRGETTRLIGVAGSGLWGLVRSGLVVAVELESPDQCRCGRAFKLARARLNLFRSAEFDFVFPGASWFPSRNLYRNGKGA